MLDECASDELTDLTVELPPGAPWVETLCNEYRVREFVDVLRWRGYQRSLFIRGEAKAELDAECRQQRCHLIMFEDGIFNPSVLTSSLMSCHTSKIRYSNL